MEVHVHSTLALRNQKEKKVEKTYPTIAQTNKHIQCICLENWVHVYACTCDVAPLDPSIHVHVHSYIAGRSGSHLSQSTPSPTSPTKALRESTRSNHGTQQMETAASATGSQRTRKVSFAPVLPEGGTPTDPDVVIMRVDVPSSEQAGQDLGVPGREDEKDTAPTRGRDEAAAEEAKAMVDSEVREAAPKTAEMPSSIATRKTAELPSSIATRKTAELPSSITTRKAAEMSSSIATHNTSAEVFAPSIAALLGCSLTMPTVTTSYSPPLDTRLSPMSDMSEEGSTASSSLSSSTSIYELSQPVRRGRGKRGRPRARARGKRGGRGRGGAANKEAGEVGREEGRDEEPVRGRGGRGRKRRGRGSRWVWSLQQLALCYNCTCILFTNTRTYMYIQRW